jgi:AraC-like DNA-binding protein
VQTHSYEEIVEHIGDKYSLIDYDGRKVYLFGQEREFSDHRHIVAFHETCSPPIPEHILSYVLLTYCLSGSFPLIVDGKPTTLGVGQCVVLDRQVPHAVGETGPDDIGMNVILPEEFFDGFMLDGIADLSSPFATQLTTVGAPHADWRFYDTGDDEVARVCVERILCERLEPDMTSQYMMNFFLAALFTHLMRTYEPHGQLDDVAFQRSELVGRVREYIGQHYREGNLAQMARDLGYERTYLSKFIRASTGLTFKQLVNAERMRHAALMLRGTTEPIYEVAQAVGLANLTSFYQRFREYAGMTPQEYRQQR